MTFADKVLNLRKRAGLSQEELAERLGVSRQAISRWEMGLAMPDASNLLQLSGLFRVTVDYLINDAYESDEDIPIVKTKEASLNKEMKKVPAMIKSVLIGTAIALLLALLLFPLTAELPVLLIPIIALPFPVFYFSVFCKEIKSPGLILGTSAVLLLAVNAITLAGFVISYHAHFGQETAHLIMWDHVLCLMNAAALLSLGSFLAFAAKPKPWWANLLIYAGESLLWSAVVFILYGITSDSSWSHIMVLTIGVLLCAIGGVAYILQTKNAGKRHGSEQT